MNRGELIGYIKEECNNCERIRVELWENGDKLCEKCGWDQERKKYDLEYLR